MGFSFLQVRSEALFGQRHATRKDVGFNSQNIFFLKQFTVRGSQFFLKMCPPFVSLLAPALFYWPCSISIHLSPRSVTAGVLFRWPCRNSIHLSPTLVSARHLSPRSVHEEFLFICLPGLSLPFCVGHVAFISICLPGLSLLLSALFCWRCNISIHSFVSEVCHCWCSAGHVAFLFMCLPALSLLVSALFRWPCSISIHLSPSSVTVGVRPVPVAMQHFYSFPREFTVRGSQFSLHWPRTVSIHLPGSAPSAGVLGVLKAF